MFRLQFSVLILTLWDEGVGLRNMDTLLLQYKLLGRNVASSIDHIWAQVHFPMLQWPNKRLFFFSLFFWCHCDIGSINQLQLSGNYIE